MVFEDAEPNPLGKFDDPTKPIEVDSDGKANRGARATRDSSTVLPPGRRGVIAKGMTKFYGNMGSLVALGCMDCGGIIVASAEQRGDEWEELAKQNPAVKRTLEAMLEKTAVGMVVAGNLTLISAIVVHHSTKVQSVIERISASRQPEQSEPANGNGNHIYSVPPVG